MTDHSMSLEEILSKIRETAEADGKVTDEETLFLSQLEADIKSLENSITEASKDESISEDEFHEFIILRDKILNHATSHESASDDINQMVNTLFDIINNFELPGMFDDEIVDNE